MKSQVVLVQKFGKTWGYLVNREFHVVPSVNGSLFEQFIQVVSHIREVHDFYNEHIIVCSSMLVKDVTVLLRNVFPLVAFVPIQTRGVMHVFRQVMEYAGDAKPARGSRHGKVLYVCSDASLSSESLGLSGWAWVSNVAGVAHYNFGVSEQRSIVHAELEGILHAIVDNRTAPFSTIHVYCDSQRSVEWMQRLLFEKHKDSFVSTLDKRTKSLVEVARKVASEKNVRVEWVKGHRTHRLNVGADYLSREARKAASRRERLELNSESVQAVVEVVSH